MMAGVSTTLAGRVTGFIVALAVAFAMGWLARVGADNVGAIGLGAGGAGVAGRGGTAEAGGAGVTG